MEFSYLQAVKSEVDLLIFQRGQRLYIDGNVVDERDLLLAGWKEYEILDRKQIYFAKLPILEPTKLDYNKLFLTLSEVWFCDCDYFASQKVCPHLVAVCAKIDAENKEKFQKLTQNSQRGLNFIDQNYPKNGAKLEIGKQINSQILNQLLHSEKEKLETKWLSSWEFYIENVVNEKHRLWHKKLAFLQEVATNLDYNQQFLMRIKQDFDYIRRDYHREKNLIQLAGESVLAGGQFWYSFWRTELNLTGEKWKNELKNGLGSPEQIINFWWQIWQWRNQTQIQLIWATIKSDLASLESSLKQQIFAKLEQNNSSNPIAFFRLQLELAMTLELVGWLASNLEKLDTKTLVEILDKQTKTSLSEQKEKTLIDTHKIENLLKQKILVWSNFLPSGDYDEIVGTLTTWRAACWSETWQETVEIIAWEHSKKPKLVKELKELFPDLKLRKKSPNTFKPYFNGKI